MDRSGRKLSMSRDSERPQKEYELGEAGTSLEGKRGNFTIWRGGQSRGGKKACLTLRRKKRGRGGIGKK